MRYNDFKNRFSRFPVISTEHIYDISGSAQVLRNQLTAWQKKGLILRLRKGLYTLNAEDRKIHPSRIFLANQIYSPSYVSCEYALGYYDLIPEKVEDVTSVTTKKTASFRNAFGHFRYHHLKIPLFFGFRRIEDENGSPVFVAEPEKAVLDFLYLNLSRFKGETTDIFEDSYRFQNTSKLKGRKLRDRAKAYQNETFSGVVTDFLAFMERSPG